MLVINGIDAQTNSHDTGVVHSWTGRNTLGAPSLTALFAAAKAPNLPMTYVGAGGFNATAGLVPLSRINNTEQLKELANPNSTPWDNNPIRSFSSMTRIQALRQKRLDRMMARNDLMGRDRANLEAFNQAVQGQSLLKTVANKVENSSSDHTLRARVDVALTAFQTGVASAADRSRS